MQLFFRVTLYLLLHWRHVIAGSDDSTAELALGFSNLPTGQPLHQVGVTTECGAAPSWLAGSFIRHACGVFGETGSNATNINNIDHMFDCIEMGQSYVFHEGAVRYSSKFYDTNIVDIYRNYGEDMNESSVFWATAFADRNVSAMEAMKSNVSAPGKSEKVPSVSWWKLGTKVLAMTETLNGNEIDIHNIVDLQTFPYIPSYGINGLDGDNWNYNQVPAHEHYSEDGTVWSSTGIFRIASGLKMESRRVVYTLDPVTRERKVVAEWAYNTADLTQCRGPGHHHPDPDAGIHYLHAFQMTRNYIIIPESSYILDPCSGMFPNETMGIVFQHFYFNPEATSRLRVVRKTDGELIASIPVPAFFPTHMLGAYEDDGVMHLDMITYEDASPYTKYTWVEEAIHGHMKAEGDVTRFTLNMTAWTLNETKQIVKFSDTYNYEFSNINYKYQGRPYKFAYMVRNPFHLHGAIAKLNVDTGAMIQYEMPNGLFPTEPWFVERPGAHEEDDGVILVSGIDGKQEKGFLMIFNASNMNLLSHSTAPQLSLFGLHAKFFTFDIGCSDEDCTPAWPKTKYLNCYIENVCGDVASILHAEFEVDSPFQCEYLCSSTPTCSSFSWYSDNGDCLLYSTTSLTTQCPSCVSGPSECPTCSTHSACQVLHDNQIDLVTSVVTESQCQLLCASTEDCTMYTWYDQDAEGLSLTCSLFSSCPQMDQSCSTCFTGPPICSNHCK